jgi:hypothetical protein
MKMIINSNDSINNITEWFINFFKPSSYSFEFKCFLLKLLFRKFGSFLSHSKFLQFCRWATIFHFSLFHHFHFLLFILQLFHDIWRIKSIHLRLFTIFLLWLIVHWILIF